MSILFSEPRRLTYFNHTGVIERWILETTKAGKYTVNFTLGGDLVNRRLQLKAGRRELLSTAREHVLLQAQQILTL